MGIWVCGDTHGEYDLRKLNKKDFLKEVAASSDDQNYLIVCGDWGGIWDGAGGDRYVQSFYNEAPWTTLWVDGNHENFDILAHYPVEKWNGGDVQFISDKIIHLMRGQVYTIEGKTFFTMGGARSTDIWTRVENRDWWQAEMPNNQEFAEGLDNLTEVDNKVDFIITHTAPDDIIRYGFGYNSYGNSDKLTQFLQIVSETVEFKGWYFGHFHADRDFGLFHSLYNSAPRKIV